MFAEIVFPIAVDGVFDYIVPENFQQKIKVGMSVKVPFRNQKMYGLVIRLKNSSQIEKLKEIESIRQSAGGGESEYIIKFYQWIATFYQCSFGKVLKPALNKNIVNKNEKEITLYYVKNMPQEAGFTATQIKEMLNLSDYALKKKVKTGEIEAKKEKVYREAGVSALDFADKKITLSQEQQNAVHKILNTQEFKPFLLFGITGSGKTHIYTEVAKKILSDGKSVIILVPEISLTPQTIARFERELGTACAVIHSRMSAGERRDAIESIMQGERKLLIGVRSAILVPMDNVGLIVVDEEHDASYKQTDPEPRYNARDTAIMRAKLQNAKIILGSATPSFESFYNCQIGKFERIDLLNRHIGAKLPDVKIVNMLKNTKGGKRAIISDELRENIQKCLDENKQIILFLNRRGYSVNLVCNGCGQVKFCPRCSVGLVYHRNGDKLCCHICGHYENPNYKCESCGNETVKYDGFGIQKVEDELKMLFAEAKILRMDADTTSSKSGHAKIIEDFAERKYNILLGTQMVAKGLDFAGVKLVGVLQADIGLSVPDFRAGEKMFQLLTQVAGRAGRADDDGLVIIQTFSPEEPSIKFAQKHDYTGYFDATIDSRKRVGFPPFVKIAKIKITGETEENAKNFSNKIAEFLHKNTKEIKILGPVESSVFKVENRFNFVMLIKSPSYKTLCEALEILRKNLPQKSKNANVSYKIDLDPTNLW
ncbi:MAG: primosomal protein N' [Chitinivibrionia bacterium]|nr:primosomal protein N' [Chitinivibrionia bacterium]